MQYSRAGTGTLVNSPPRRLVFSESYMIYTKRILLCGWIEGDVEKEKCVCGGGAGGELSKSNAGTTDPGWTGRAT